MVCFPENKLVRGGDGEGGDGGSGGGDCNIGECRMYEDANGCGYWRLGFCYRFGKSWSQYQTASQPCGYA